MRPEALVSAVGARTPIGLDAISTAFLYRACIAGMRQSTLLDGNDDPATMCLLDTLDPQLVGIERVLALAAPALRETIEALGPLSRTMRVKLLLALDERLAEGGGIAAAKLTETLARRAAKWLPGLSAEHPVFGPAGFGLGMARMLDELRQGTVDIVIAGGAHSDHDPDRIKTLSAKGRLFTPDNLDALIPGEGAAFAALVSPALAQHHKMAVHGEVHAIANAHDEATPDDDNSAFKAFGITAVVRKATESLQQSGTRVGWMLTDQTSETLRLYELQAMGARTQKLWCEPQLVDAPGQRLGHLGSAAMPLHLVLTCEAWRRGWAPHPLALSLAGNDGGERAAMLLSAPGQ